MTTPVPQPTGFVYVQPNPAVAFHTPAQTITALSPTTALTGARFVAITGPRIAEMYQVGNPAAGAHIFGVVMHDVPAGEEVGLWHAPGQIVPVLAGAALTNGQAVGTDALGQAVPLASLATGALRAGYALDDCPSGSFAVIDINPA